MIIATTPPIPTEQVTAAGHPSRVILILERFITLSLLSVSKQTCFLSKETYAFLNWLFSIVIIGIIIEVTFTSILESHKGTPKRIGDTIASYDN